jgi:hypothetical protein
VQEAKGGSSTGWWDSPLPGVPSEMSTLASLEADAIGLTDWSASLVPGLLQTYDYAVGVMGSGDASARDVEMRWMARLRRQQILGKVDYTAFIGGAVLRTPFGGPAALREQLQHLIGARTRGIRVRVLPEHVPHVLVAHSWLLMEFANTSPVVYVEARFGSLYLHDEVAQTYLSLLNMLDKAALSPSASQDLMRKTLEEM